MNNRNRNISHNGGVLRKLGDRAYRDKINKHTCKDLYKDNPECEHCNEIKIVIDLGVPALTSNNGEHICGNPDKYEWVVFRGLIIKQAYYASNNEVSKKGKGHDGTCTSIDTTESHHKMKYKTSTTITIA